MADNDGEVSLSDLEPCRKKTVTQAIEWVLWRHRRWVWPVAILLGGLLLVGLPLWPALVPTHFRLATAPSGRSVIPPCGYPQGTTRGKLIGIAVLGQGRIYVADMGSDRIREIEAGGDDRLSWGCLGRGEGQFDFGLNESEAVAVDHARTFYVADSDNARIQRFDAGGHFLLSWSGPSSPLPFYPVAVATDGQDNVYAVDFNNARIEKFDSGGHPLLSWGSPGRGNGQFAFPDGIAIDGWGNVYVADRENARIEKFDGKGHFLLSWGSHGQRDGQFAVPVGIAVGGQDRIYVADRDNGRVEMFTSDGRFLRKWDHLRGVVGQGIAPIGVAVSAGGSIYIIAQDTACIQKLSFSGDWVVDWTC